MKNPSKGVYLGGSGSGIQCVGGHPPKFAQYLKEHPLSQIKKSFSGSISGWSDQQIRTVLSIGGNLSLTLIQFISFTVLCGFIKIISQKIASSSKPAKKQ